jgi:Uma2 family endonuclease
MSVGVKIRQRGVLLRNVSWEIYVELCNEPENRHVRMSFDRGELELTSSVGLRERLKHLIGRCIYAWTELHSVPIQSLGSTTLRREDLSRALDPDNAYYIFNEPFVRHREELDLSTDPPLDLAVEIDVTDQLVSRMSIFDAIGVPEIWRWCDDNVYVHALGQSGEYAEIATSRALPGFSMEKMVNLLRAGAFSDETTLIREFQAFCRA